MSIALRRDPHRGTLVGAAYTSRADDWAPLSLLGPALRARVRQRAARLRDQGPAAVGLVPVDRPGDGAARPGAGRRARGSPARWSTASCRDAPSTACSSTSPRSRRSRCSAASRSTPWSATSTPRYGDAAVVRRRRLRRRSWRPTRSTSRWSPRRPRIGYGVPVRQMLGSFVTALPSEFATAPADRERRLHLRPSRHGVGRSGRGDPLRLPLHPAHERPGRGSWGGADQAHPRARLAADGPALDGPADAVDARCDDRPPLGGGRALLTRGRRA